MRIVIVGASGNVGTAVLRLLRARSTPIAVAAVSRRTPPPEPPYDIAHWHRIDLSAPGAAERLVPALDGADAVVNLAWGFQPTRDADQLQRVGGGGSTAVVEAAARADVTHLVHMSSVGAYRRAERGQRVDESCTHDAASTVSPVLRPRTMVGQLTELVRSGPITRRRQS